MSRYRLLITDGGPHSAEDWAQVTAEHLFSLPDKPTSGERSGTLRLQNATMECLIPHHRATMEIHRQKLGLSAIPAWEHSFDDGIDAFNAISAALPGSPFEYKLQDDSWRTFQANEIACHKNTIKDIEERWHRDRGQIVMAGITSGIGNSWRNGITTKKIDHTITTGDVFAAALFVASPSGTYNNQTANYTNMGSDELATGSGYTRPGFLWTAAQNITPVTGSDNLTTIINWSVSPSWTSATFSTLGLMIYDSTAGGLMVQVNSFGSPQSVSGGTFTAVLPATGVSTAIQRIS